MAEKSSDSVVNVRLSYRQLDECRREMSDVIMSLQKECRENSERIRYLEDFIRYRNLEDEFRHFCENAHEDLTEDLPFPHLVL